MSVQHRNQLMENRKRADNAYRAMDAVIAADKKVLQMAKFENDTTSKIERRMKAEEFQRRRNDYEVGLYNRRQALAALYNSEMESWKAEILSHVETQEDRKARIMERAYALRDAREKERARFVKEKYDEQWRDACDDARTLDSKAMTKYMNNERLKQIQEKIQRKQNLSSQENNFLTEWNRQLEALEQKDRAKQEYRAKVDAETSAYLRYQIDNNRNKKENEFLQRRQDEEDELNRLRQEIEADEALQRQRQRDSYQRGQDVLKFNAETKKLKDEEKYIEREQNAILLDYALRKEQEANEAEEAKRNANRSAAMKYRKYLEEQMVKEAEDTAIVDEIRKQEEEKVWKARDDALKARDDARKYLMKMVDEGRQEQIQARKIALEREKMEGQVFADRFIEEAKEAVKKERAELEARRISAMDNNIKLKEQIEYRKQREELDRQEAYLEDKQMKYMERLHQQRLAEQGGAIRDFRPLKKNSWYS